MTNDKNKTFSSPLTDEHAREAERLKKAWFDHVFSSIERLGENVDKVSSDLQSTKTEFYKDVFAAKEALRDEMFLLRREINADMDKIEKRLLIAIDVVSKNVDNLPVKEVKDELKKELETVKKELKKEIDVEKEALIPLKADVVKLRITMAKWGGLGGLIVSALLYTVKWIVPIIVSGLQHTP
jgi:hypothetical protein